MFPSRHSGWSDDSREKALEARRAARRRMNPPKLSPATKAAMPQYAAKVAASRSAFAERLHDSHRFPGGKRLWNPAQKKWEPYK